ncbi:Uma2 family endonuclease [Streptomyces sp. NPDC096040]|uniref:Uma2 family endonuclease n=1 Tax=Streptomyces sp. NPDC096040 TaxID=3155541 RepID=UPI00332BA966
MAVSSDAWSGPRPHPGNLREVAERIEKATGLRVQIVGGKLVLSPTPGGKHAGVVHQTRHRIGGVLPERLGAFEVSSIALPDDPDDYVTPDLIVLPMEWTEDDDWLAAPEDTALAVEVISASEKSREIRDKADRYAVARVPVLLVVDPRHGTRALHTRPDNGACQDMLSGKYGETVPLFEPLGIEVATDGFPVHGEPPRSPGRLTDKSQ